MTSESFLSTMLAFQMRPKCKFLCKKLFFKANPKYFQSQNFRAAYEFRPAAGGQGPEFTSPIRDQFGAERGHVKFECEVEAEPRAEIQWYRGTKELAETPKYTILNKGKTQTLLINNLHLEDEDEYTCKATNTMGSRTTRAQLKLSGKFLMKFN